MDITYRQSLQITSGKTPSTTGGTITEQDFSINPAEQLSITDWNEDLFHRFILPSGAINYPFPMGTVTTASLLVFKPIAVNLSIKVVNANGTSQLLQFSANRTSVVHMEFTGLLATNSTLNVIKGIFYLVGI